MVSVVRPGELKELKIFEVDVGILNRQFLMTALLTAATVSLASLIISFWNEGREYLKEKLSQEAGRSIDIIRRDLEFTRHADEAIAAVKRVAGSEDMRLYLANANTPLNWGVVHSLLKGALNDEAVSIIVNSAKQSCASAFYAVSELQRFSQSFSALQKSINNYRRASKLSNVSHVVEIAVIGVMVPAGVYFIAFLHVIGALMSEPYLPSLPSLFAA